MALTGFGDDTFNDLNVQNDLDVDGEVKVSVCQTIGTLGYILLDEQRYTSASYNNVFSLDSQNTSNNFSMYKFIGKGHSDGSGFGTIELRMRFHDIDGQMSATNGYWTSCYNFDGTSRANTRTTFCMVGFHNLPANENTKFSIDMTIQLDQVDETECSFTGQYSSRERDGTGIQPHNISGGLTDVEVINTRIVGIGFTQAGDTGPNFLIEGRVYRLL